MPKNNGKGGKYYKKIKHEENNNRELIFKEEEQEYAIVEKILGGCKFDVKTIDGKIWRCSIRGKMVKKDWVSRNDIVLISLREYQKDNIADIIHKYNPNEVRQLKKYGHLPENFTANNDGETQEDVDSDDEGNVTFEIEDI